MGEPASTRASLPSSQRTPEPARIGRYELLFELGSGGMATVLLGLQMGDAGFERFVAIKRVHAHVVKDPEEYELVSDEARVAGLVRHANVVSVVDVVDRQGELLLVFDYVEGFNLAELLRANAGPVPSALACRVVVDSLRGLHAAHEARDPLGIPLDVIHRDVSPENLLVGTDGSTRVLDFGIARSSGAAHLTRTGVVRGKVRYMAPERLDDKPIDRRVDLFAMGAILYELVVGAPAFGMRDSSGEAAKVMLAQVDLEPLTRAAPELTPIVERALKRNASDRFASAEEMIRALTGAITPEQPEEVARWVGRIKRQEVEARRARISKVVEERAMEEPLPPSAETVKTLGASAKETEVALVTPQTDPLAERTARKKSNGLLMILVGLMAAMNLGAWALYRPDRTSATPAREARGVESSTSSSSPPTPGPTSVASEAAPLASDPIPSARTASSAAPSSDPAFASVTLPGPRPTASSKARDPQGKTDTELRKNPYHPQ